MTKIPEWWEKIKLSNLIEIKHGFAFKWEYISDTDNWIVLLTPWNFLIWWWRKEWKKRYTWEIPSDYILKGWDLVVTMTDLSKDWDTLWYPALIPNDESRTFLHNQRIWFVTITNEKIDKMFLYYLMRNREYQKFIVNFASWSTVRHTSPDRIRSYEFFLPTKDEQKIIAKTLSSFDDKIELLRAENQTLEEMGQTLFKERFGKYKAWDELPDGWKVGKLGDIVDNYDSKRIPIASDKREIWEYPYYWATGINWYVKDYIFDWIYTLLWEDWSVMKENWKPFTQYVWWKIRVNNHAHVLQWKNWFSTEIIKIILDSVDITPYVTWAVQLKISQWNMNSIPVIIPTDDVLVKFNSLINPIFAKIRANSEEIESLSKTRDQLLPKLMSWEVRVEF